MARLSKAPLLSVMLVSALILGVLGGAAIAQTVGWQRPGDDVVTIQDAEVALAYWNNIQRDTDPAHEPLWFAFGEMADNLMGLDIRTRQITDESKIAALEARLADLEASQTHAFVVHANEVGGALLTDTPTAYVTVTVAAPVAGQVTVNSTALVQHFSQNGDVLCVITEASNIPSFDVSPFLESAQKFTNFGIPAAAGSLSGTRTFDIGAGETNDYVLACEETIAGGSILAQNLTAIFTPAP